MPKFGRKSLENLSGCDPILQLILKLAIVNSPIDFSITFGHRDRDTQMKLFRKGRKIKDGKWIIDNKDKVVTYCDGRKKLSHHNYLPSRAVDVAPYPKGYKAPLTDFYILAGYILGIASQVDDSNNFKIEWGGLWRRFKDYPHFQIKHEEVS